MAPVKLEERRTNFTLDYGGVFEWSPAKRTIVRFDISQTLAAEYDKVLDRLPSLEVIQPGHIAQHLGLGLSVARRFGAIRDEQEQEPARSTLDLGILFSLQQRVHQTSSGQIPPNRGGGAWASYNFSRYLSLDGSAFYSPQDDHDDYPQDGGKDFAAFWGFKMGIRRDRLGYFVKARPGLMQFSRTEQVFDYPNVRWGKTTDFAMDVGGVVEVYPVAHLILRADAGNAFVHYHGANVSYIQPNGSEGNAYYPPLRRVTILLQFGAGLRF
jgi:hypothetical protein